jgi:hypothetical protein
MMTYNLFRFRVVVILLILRGVALRFKPELQLLMLLTLAYWGNQYITATADYTICGMAILRKYRSVLSLFLKAQ